MKITIHVKTKNQLQILNHALHNILEMELAEEGPLPIPESDDTPEPDSTQENTPVKGKREVRTKLACQTARSKILSILRSRRRGLTPKQVQEIMGYKSSSLARHDLLALVKENQVRVNTKTNSKGIQEVRYFATG